MQNIIRQFFIDYQMVSLVPFGKGHINQTYRLSIEQQGVAKNFILQQINQQVFKQPIHVIENMIAVSQHIAQKTDYPLHNLTIIPTVAGEYYVLDEGNYWRLLPFIKNTITFATVENEVQAYAAAQGFSAFTKSLLDFPAAQLHETIPHFHDSLFRLNHFQKAVEEADLDRKKAAQIPIQFIEQESFIFQYIDQLNLPLRVTHNDTKIDNVLIHKDTIQPACVIDLDTVMPGYLLADFGDMVRTFTNSEKEDSTNFAQVAMRMPIFQALVRGFLSELAPLMTLQEKKHLVDGAKWIILEQAMRFLSDFLQNDVYYKIAFAEHNLVRAKNQIALYQSLLSQEQDLLSYLESF
jgi:Ser/Thr protein kinase RdoA (MazF antagonist)